jgi:hypothetical protein
MGAAIKLNECYDDTSGEKLPPRVRAENSNSSGGNVDEILKRLDAVQSTVSETREQVANIRDARVEISELRTEVRSIAAIIPHLATKADLKAEIGSVGTEIGSVRTEVRSGFASQKAEMKISEIATIKWIIAIVLSSAGLAATIARFAR